MSLTDKETITVLQEELKFSPSWANVYVRTGGRCEYCGCDLLRDRLGYAAANVDHLLPKKKYDDHINERKKNWVLCCSCCNSTKKAHDILRDGEDAEDMLKNKRTELITRARAYIADRMRDYDRDWRRATEILSKIWWERLTE